jgi:hypothetical protein
MPDICMATCGLAASRITKELQYRANEIFKIQSSITTDCSPQMDIPYICFLKN